MIVFANTSDAKQLTEIALKSKAFWGYSNDLIESWREDLTITNKIIQECIVKKSLVDGIIAGFYILNPPKNESIELETTSFRPSKSDAITGNPVDMPSIAIRPNPSTLEGMS